MRLYALPMIALALAACSDNNPATDGGTDGGNVPDVQADVAADAPADAPTTDGGGDAGVVVSGTVAITDMTVLDPDAVAMPSGWHGGSISIEFDNTADGKGGKVVSGTTPINDCIVTQYDPTHLPHGQLDADAIQIADAPGDAGTTTGLLKTVGPCTYQAALGGYTCISSNETAQAVTAAGNNATVPGTVAYVLTKPLTGQSLVGSWLMINGFTNTKYNSGASSAFPIVGQPNDTTLIVINLADPTATTATPEAATTGISYTVLNGYAPVPGAGPTAADFLGTGSISVTKAANSVWPAISTTVDVPGQGWTLSDPGDPTALPLTGTATALNFGCSTGNSCGDGSTTAVKVMIVNGWATKKALTGLASFQMPTKVPGTDTWLEFQCAFLGNPAKYATLTAPAGQAIIDFNPTRVETRVIYAAGAILTSGSQSTNLLVGHGFVGHTTK